MKLILPVKPRKGCKLLSNEAYTDKRGRTTERFTVWLKIDQSKAIGQEVKR